VLCRLSPGTAAEDVRSLEAMEVPVADDPEMYELAVRLSIDLDHHLLHTLYHAVALLTDDATFVTADARYAGKAGDFGRLRVLVDAV
jgi:hypothetical protein